MRPDDAAPEPAGGGLPADPAAYFRQLGEQTSQVLAAAEQAAQGIRDQARKDAAGIVAEARMRAEEVAREAAGRRRAAEEELRRFRAARTILANQIEDVHRRLEEVILRLKTPVEAPDSGRGAPVPVEAPPAAVPLVAEPVPAGTPEPAAAPPAPPAGVADEAASEPLEEPAPELEVEADGQAELLDVAVAVAVEQAVEQAVDQAVEQVVETLEEALEPGPAAPATGAPVAGEPDAEPTLPEPEPVLPEPEPEPEAELGDPEEREGFANRREALGDAPLLAARSLKRLLQEDQNDLLDRIRRHRGRGTFEADIMPPPVQVERFVAGLRSVLEPAFRAGRRLGGAPTLGDPADSVAGLVAKQVVAPLRRDLARMVEPRLAAGDTATTVSERAGDVYRVWKGVRTELLGEGLAYAAFHHGLLDAWREANGPGKRWVMSPDEADCPRDVCRTNAAAGGVNIDASFPSGHLAPPAHGACTCTIIATRV